MIKLRVTHIEQRGNFLDPGAEVQAATPAAFFPMPGDAPLNRLGLAEWLVNKENPLTARVTVNRFWARLFGRGIVEKTLTVILKEQSCFRWPEQIPGHSMSPLMQWELKTLPILTSTRLSPLRRCAK